MPERERFEKRVDDRMMRDRLVCRRAFGSGDLLQLHPRDFRAATLGEKVALLHFFVLLFNELKAKGQALPAAPCQKGAFGSTWLRAPGAAGRVRRATNERKSKVRIGGSK